MAIDNSSQRAVLPVDYRIQSTICELWNQSGGSVWTIHFLDRINDIAGGHVFGLQTQNLAIHLCKVSLSFIDKLRFERTGSTTLHLEPISPWPP